MLDTALVFLKDQLKAHMELYHCNVFLGRAKEYVGNEPYVLIHLLGMAPLPDVRNKNFPPFDPNSTKFSDHKKALKASLLFKFNSGPTDYEKSLECLNAVAEYYYINPVVQRQQLTGYQGLERIVISICEITLEQQLMIFEKSAEENPYLLYEVQIQGL